MVEQQPYRPDSPLVAFAGGGTGGHLYPALAIADALRDRLGNVRFLFFGTERPMDRRIVDRPDCELVRQTLPPLCRAPWRWPTVLIGFRRSSLLCRSRIGMDRPAVVVGTGGYGSVPPLREAHRAGIATVLLNPDALPGRANRHLCGPATMIFVQWEQTAGYFPQSAAVFVTGCAIRPEFRRVDRPAAWARFGLRADRKTLLVTGASQGAQTINQAVLANLDWLQTREDWQVVHLTGDRDHARVKQAYASRSIHASVLPFTVHMADALAVADLVVARSGASTLAEITALGKPSILMPYPFHKDQHQLANARCLVRASAARIVRDAVDPAVNGPSLRHVLEHLMTDDEKRGAMAAAAQRLGRAGAADDIARRIGELIGSNGMAVRDRSWEGSSCARP